MMVIKQRSCFDQGGDGGEGGVCWAWEVSNRVNSVIIVFKDTTTLYT